MQNNSINWLAVVVATVAGMFIGFLWYGLFFQAAWAEAVGFTGPGLVESGAEVFKRGEPVTLEPTLPMIINAISLAIYALIMNWLVGKTSMTGWGEGAKLGAIVGCIPLLTTYVANRFAMEPTMLSVIDGSYYVVLFAAIGAIIGGWRK